MSFLGEDFIYETNSYIEQNTEEFTWSGYRVAAYDSDGVYKLGYFAVKEEDAVKLKEELEEKYFGVKVINLATKKEVEF